MTEIKTENRLFNLLKDWMDDKKESFQKELKGRIKTSFEKGEILLSQPQLSFSNYKFFIKFPREIIGNIKQSFNEEDCPTWNIYKDSTLIQKVEVSTFAGSFRIFTEEVSTEIPSNLVFDKLKLSLESETKKYAQFSFESSDFKFFDMNGKYFNYKKVKIPAGDLICISKTENIPKLLDSETESINANDYYISLFRTHKDDIIITPNGTAFQVESDIKEGICNASPLKNVYTIKDDEKINIYSELPKLLIKLDKNRLSSTAITFSHNNENQRFKLSDINYQEFKLDEKIENTYGYILKFSDFIKEEGIYNIEINIQNKALLKYAICYLKNFEFEFENAPYIFKTECTLNFKNATGLKTNLENKCDSYLETGKSYTIPFDEIKTEDKDLNQGILKFEYKNKINLYFVIPVLKWSFDKENWNYQKPKEISKRNAPKHLFVSGPFDFEGTNTYLSITQNGIDDDNEIYAEKVKDCDFYEFKFSSAVSSLSSDMDKGAIELNLNGKTFEFVSVICRSKIISYNLTGDFEKQKIYGFIDIFGDSEYLVTIWHNNEIIAEDVPIKDGKFEVSANIEPGNYLIRVFEIYDEDGFSTEVYGINKKPLICYLTDFYHLDNCALKILSIQDMKNLYEDKYFCKNYIISKLSYIDNVSALIQNIAVWKLDLDNESLLNNCTFYFGNLYGENHNNEYHFEHNVLIIFYDKKDINKAIILVGNDFSGSGKIRDDLEYKNQIEYNDFIYEKIGNLGKLRLNENQSNILQKKEKYNKFIFLFDDYFKFNFQLKKLKDKGEKSNAI